LWKLVYLSDYILQQSAFFRRRRAALEDVDWLDESLHYALDWDLLIRLGKRFGLHYAPEYFGALREYPETKSFAGGAGTPRGDQERAGAAHGAQTGAGVLDLQPPFAPQPLARGWKEEFRMAQIGLAPIFETAG
jgi:hypothetical protein